LKENLDQREKTELITIIHYMLHQQSSRPKTIHAQFDLPKCKALRAMLHQSPRTYGKPTSVWTLSLAAQVWWSRVAQPRMHTWSEVKQPLRLQELQVSKEDPGPKALCCYGILDASSQEIRLRFVDGRPVSQVTTDFLEWLCEPLTAHGHRTLVVIWDNASWHVSKHVRGWFRQHNQAALQAQREGKPGLQLIPCWLPTWSPWLNRIEPHWVHGKRAIVEPARLLTANEVIQRVCDYFGCVQVASLTQQAA
jgi:hypothetical protein